MQAYHTQKIPMSWACQAARQSMDIRQLMGALHKLGVGNQQHTQTQNHTCMLAVAGIDSST